MWDIRDALEVSMSDAHEKWFDAPSTLDREAELLAPYAMHTRLSRGRRHPEEPHPFRTSYQRDRDRIIHSSAFRRLMYKT
jgi:dGTPase